MLKLTDSQKLELLWTMLVFPGVAMALQKRHLMRCEDSGRKVSIHNYQPLPRCFEHVYHQVDPSILEFIRQLSSRVSSKKTGTTNDVRSSVRGTS